MAAAPWVASAGTARPARGSRDVIVHVLLRGGMDGLTTCVPHGDPDYYAARPNLAVPPPGQTGGALDLDGFFGLAPAAAPLMTPYANGHLAIVHAAGSTDPTRSHFNAFTHMEFGIPNQPLSSVSTGWLARHLQTTPALGSGPMRGVAISSLMPKTLAGAPMTLPIADLASFDFPGNPNTVAARRLALTDMYSGEPAPVGPAALSTMGSIDLLEQIDFENYVPAPGVVYPNFALADELKQAAALIKANVDVETIYLEKGGWDTHDAQGVLVGRMADLLDELTSSLEAFYLDMLGQIDDVVIVVMSEFGRRVAENASLGTDHGHGNCMLVIGGAVAGGVLTQWPGLAPANLDNGDLAITTDYRDILAEILDKRAGNTNLETVFPNHTPAYQGVIL